MNSAEYNRAYYAANRDAIRARQSERGRTEEAKARRRAYYAAHREEILARRQRYAEANRELIRECERRAREKHRNARASAEAARRARMRGAGAEFVDRLILYERDGGVCGICGDPVAIDDFHVDHVVPLARGGEHTYANTQIAHPSCNLSKHNRLQTAAA